MISIYLEEVDSTNSYLKRNYKDLDDKTFVYADYQWSGRGRSGRSWQSEKGKNLLFSVLVKNEKILSKYKELSVISALSVLQVLQKYQIDDVELKWPNDVYVNGKKICGILLEGISSEKLECLIIGIGINVNQKDFEDNLIVCPTSLKNCLNAEVDSDNFRMEVFKNISSNLDNLADGTDFYEQVRKYDYLKGKKAVAVIHGKEETVEVIGINKDYSLALRSGDEIKNIESGEISFHL